MKKLLLQDELSECGLVCLAHVSSKLGGNEALNELRRKYPVSNRGLNLREMKDIAADIGLVGRAVSCEVDELADLKTPAILHWNFQHFVVLEKVKRNKYLVFDPAFGTYYPSIKDISSKFTGVALELTPAASFVRRRRPSELSLSSWFKFSREMWTPLGQIIFLSFVLQAYVIATPFYLQTAIDQAALKGDDKILGALAVGFAMFCVFNAGATFLRGVVTTNLTSLLNWDMSLRLFRHLIRLPLPWFQKRRLADVLSRFDAISPVRDILSGSLVSAIVDGTLALVTLAMMLLYDLRLGLIVIAGFMCYIFLRLISIPVTIKLGAAAMMAKIAESGKRIESIRAIQTIKIMGAENERESEWANKFAETIKRDQALSIVNLGFGTLQSLVDGLVKIFLIYLGVKSVMQHQMSIGVLYAFLSYQTQFSSKANALFDQYVKWRNTGIYSYRLADIVLTKQEDGLTGGGMIDRVIEGNVDVRGLYFTYAVQEKYILSNISFSIKKGEFVAIVGPSGTGKSTLLKIICGLYPVAAGEILIDGQSLRSWGTRAVRRSLGVVMQDDELLSGSIAENVAFFDDCIDIDKVWRCLRAAALYDEVNTMPMRAETLVGDLGSTLSGGQKQRMLLARALYREPQILILDEATSSLDAERESSINIALKQLAITRIIVAHRKETIDAADRIIGIDQGVVIFDRLKQTS
ncbi:MULTISPECIES: peptidase domain-containing ABC transporter [unclassified Janthinobacterium]|uniref:peptidase domain-containing ABC transporter n=1 Tax=unclassified Janthinobacterium TaxID=2610881 RepID=UPI00185344A0|nr:MULTISPECIES: peptidase domain-containing ABC transporter [unclassified Janthinobacterium]MBB5369461.1 ATP-binding cassette subfamily B protein RaxB [Janthinobacterium sp. K2C7]MBB5382583.1 ATP-binding cassette subfamily B protein RaxB [Janthinobacterium sp. K2Li3]MBB5388160.1 ATP-binding cassette subfamily B protein RaxB [Janthinobacterium sp. K2E3]